MRAAFEQQSGCGLRIKLQAEDDNERLLLDFFDSQTIGCTLVVCYVTHDSGAGCREMVIGTAAIQHAGTTHAGR